MVLLIHMNYEGSQRLLHTLPTYLGVAWKHLFRSKLHIWCFSLFAELNVRNVLNVLHEAGFSDGDWFQLGQQLIETTNLKTIKANHHEASNCMIETIRQWLQNDLKASWEKLAEVVTKVGGYGEATAEAVRQKAEIGKANLCSCHFKWSWFTTYVARLTTKIVFSSFNGCLWSYHDHYSSSCTKLSQCHWCLRGWFHFISYVHSYLPYN